MRIHRKAKVGALSVALLVAVPTFGAEKIQITGSTAIELPKPTHILEESKRNRAHEGPSGRSTFEGGVTPMNPTMNNNPGADKKMKEAIDRKKNWIFVNPYEMQFDNKTEEFLKGEKGTALYNHRLMSPEEKTVMDRFMDEKKPDRDSRDSRESEGDQRENGNRSDRMDQKTEPFSTAKLEGAGEKEKPKLERGLSLPPALEEKTDVFSERSAFQRKLERNPFSETAGGSRSLERSGGMSREDREARDAELSKIYQPRVTGAPVVAGIDPVNGAFDATRQEATPFSAGRADPLLNIGRAQPSAGARNSPIFTGPVNSGMGAGLPSRSSSFDDFAPRSPVAAAPNPSLTPSPANVSSFRPAPFILPKPQRKF